jgi:hypothetical protein
MAFEDYQRTIFGYHGCDRKVAQRVLSGGTFRSSDNDYDWLGKGIYFWEFGPDRAMQWALDEHKRSAKKIGTPAKVGAIIHLGRCFDLLDVRSTAYLKDAYPSFLAANAASGKKMPTNTGMTNKSGDLLMRRLDCAMINWAIAELDKVLPHPIQTVRGVFLEGEPAFPGSCVMGKSHIQIAVRDPACIIGQFQPGA